MRFAGDSHDEKSEPVENFGIDETSFQRRHEYVTVVNDLDRGRVLYVADDRKQTSLDGYWKTLSETELSAIRGIELDMWEPYLRSIHEFVPDAQEKIVFDKYHVAFLLNQAVDLVRPAENRELRALGNNVLQGNQVRLPPPPRSLHPRRLARVLSLPPFRRSQDRASLGHQESFMRNTN